MWAEPSVCRHHRCGALWWRATVAASGLGVSALRHGRPRITSNLLGAWAHSGVTELPNMGLVCYRHHELCHEGGWNLAWSDDGRLLTIPPPPDWPAPRGEPPPTDAQDERWRRANEAPSRGVREIWKAQTTPTPPADLVPF